MDILVNSTKKTVEKNLTLLELMQELYQDKTNGKAIALNNKVVPKKNWSQTSLQEKDTVLIITATQGG